MATGHWECCLRMAYATRLYRSVVHAGLLYACSAWCGYASSSDLQRITAVICREIHRSFCSPNLTCVEEPVSGMDYKLFNCILSNKYSVLYQLLPTERHCGYTLRPRKHERCLINKSRLDEPNFIYRLLFKNVLNWNVMNRMLFSILFHLSSSSFMCIVSYV